MIDYVIHNFRMMDLSVLAGMLGWFLILIHWIYSRRNRALIPYWKTLYLLSIAWMLISACLVFVVRVQRLGALAGASNNIDLTLIFIGVSNALMVPVLALGFALLQILVFGYCLWSRR